MYFSFGTIGLLAVGLLLVWFWHDSLRTRERATDAAIAACERMQLQFLDGTVAFSRLRLVRDRGELRLQRTYVFDYTAVSIERQQGFVVLTGIQVETVGFARTPAPRPFAQTATPAPKPAPAHATDEVFDAVFDDRTSSGAHKITRLDDWRKKPGPDPGSN